MRATQTHCNLRRHLHRFDNTLANTPNTIKWNVLQVAQMTRNVDVCRRTKKWWTHWTPVHPSCLMFQLNLQHCWRIHSPLHFSVTEEHQYHLLSSVLLAALFYLLELWVFAVHALPNWWRQFLNLQVFLQVHWASSANVNTDFWRRLYAVPLIESWWR